MAATQIDLTNGEQVQGVLPIANGGTGAISAILARTALGLAIGTNVQAYSSTLDTWATKTPPSGTPVGTTDSQALTNKDLSGSGNVFPSSLASKTYVDGLVGAPTFDALITRGGGSLITLPSGIDLATGGQLEVAAADSLEIPSTSTLEIPFWISALPWQGAAAAFVPTQEPIASTSYTDLTTLTDTVTVMIGPSGLAVVLIYANIISGSGGGAGFMSYAISGANTAVATDAKSIMYSATVTGGQSGGAWGNLGAFFLENGLTPGLTTFKAKYHYNAVSGQLFSNRRIAVIPL